MPLALFANNTKGKALQLLVKCSQYASRSRGDVPYLDASAALDGGTLIVNVVNRHRNEAVVTDIELEDRQFGGMVEISESQCRRPQNGE